MHTCAKYQFISDKCLVKTKLYNNISIKRANIQKSVTQGFSFIGQDTIKKTMSERTDKKKKTVWSQSVIYN